MGQSHNCLHSHLYQGERNGIDMSRRLSDRRKSGRRPRLRNAFSTSVSFSPRSFRIRNDGAIKLANFDSFRRML